MNVFRKPAAVAVAALALAALPATAEAHDGSHPFKNCTEAYENGYAGIPEGDEHYGDHLDRDGDGVGCDQPPADFVPADDEATDSGEGASSDAGAQEDTDLAETGGSSATPYLAGGGAAVLLAGGGVLFVARRRRDAR
ncbi:LAETG motif-containing sortase-dependent surface protein [Streptomyces sp. NPDC059862]|uniref:LAETG motif-containing sortase-dependent surface protein n=1 Tax=unclassified Streptomyces TaxID=2593676 RepID=UPI003626F07B